MNLLRDPRIVDAMNDPTLARAGQAFDLKKALEYAAKKMISDLRIADTGYRKDEERRIPPANEERFGLRVIRLV